MTAQTETLPTTDTELQPAITVYSLPICPKCEQTYNLLDRAKLDYEVVYITEDHEAAAFVKSLGYLQAPVVVAGKEHWGDVRYDKIRALGKAKADALKALEERAKDVA